TEQDCWLVIPSRRASSLWRAGWELDQLVVQSRTGAPQVVAPRHRSNHFRFEPVCRRKYLFARNIATRRRSKILLLRDSCLVRELVVKAMFCPQKSATQLRGGNHIIDNDEVLDIRIVSSMGLEETDASSAVATCVG
ncbi:hypothetical protein A2U01_0033872, partial [Trifolium medium]|nr:hypothetical protein [Trifolium medium]